MSQVLPESPCGIEDHGIVGPAIIGVPGLFMITRRQGPFREGPSMNKLNLNNKGFDPVMANPYNGFTCSRCGGIPDAIL